MQDIDVIIKEKYGLDVGAVLPYRDAYIINTPKGKKCLKSTRLSEGRILFIDSVKEHLYKNGFQSIDRYVNTLNGKPYVNIDNQYYILSDYVEGRECDFNNSDDVSKAARLLASMHKASRGYVSPKGCEPRDYLGKLPYYFQKRLNELKRIKKRAAKGKSKFDYLVTQYIDYFYEIGEKVIRNLMDSNYFKLVEQSRQSGQICHHDFTHTNIICGRNSMSVINFEYCCYELKVYDMANFLRRKMRKCNWKLDEAAVILKEYGNIESISRDEFVILKLMIEFPQKFWRIVNKYYNNRRSWAEKSNLDNLNDVIREIDYMSEFMKHFDELMM